MSFLFCSKIQGGFTIHGNLGKTLRMGSLVHEVRGEPSHKKIKSHKVLVIE